MLSDLRLHHLPIERIGLGAQLSKLDRTEEAESAYRKAIELSPKWVA